jgi:hypothetical protein
VLLLVIAPVVSEPAALREPLQAPEDRQEVTLVLVHERVDLPPDATVVGLAVNFTVGAALATVTVADCLADPPLPVQVNSYSDVLEIAPVEAVPFVGREPCQPPDAVQLVAFVLLQVRVELPPEATVVGLAVRRPATMVCESRVSDGAGAETDVVEPVAAALPCTILLSSHAASPAMANSPMAIGMIGRAMRLNFIGQISVNLAYAVTFHAIFRRGV